MGIETTATTYGGGDYRWLKSQAGTEYPASGTLDVSAFTITNGYIPSGTPVVLSSGKYIPAATTATGLTYSGHVLHDVAASTTGADQPFALVTNVEIVAALVPGTHDLANGRYIANLINDAVV